MKVLSPVAIPTTTATFTRATTGTYWGSNGLIYTAAINAPRITYDRETHAFKGALVEPAATNLILNNTTMSTQTRSVSAGATYTFSFYGTGQVTLTGAAAITLVGGGTIRHTTHTFTATSSSLTLTVAGTVQYAQLELGSAATSVIITAGSTVTRAADVITGNGIYYTSITDSTPLWAVGTTYNTGDVVRVAPRLYESLTDTNIGNAPATSTANWLDIGPDNISAMVDGQVSTQSISSTADAIIMMRLESAVNSAGLANVEATTTDLVIGNGYSTYSRTYITGNVTNVVATTTQPGAVVTLYVVNAGGVPAIGQLGAGTLVTLGMTEYGLGAGIIDYSKTAPDAYGVVLFSEGEYRKRMTASVIVDKADVNATFRQLVSLRAQPTFYVATDDTDYAELAVMFGWPRDWWLEIPYPTHSQLGIEIWSLI